ncbi:PLD nuclease N-terminal domain-containing protein [Rossellomorea vietnamensis]|uniref:PLD nuclease N-terminal domain-containing protein n=1 Tax=Rossellomorea vietnamensis TaxID=218284 RepID=A0ACD4C600_9BACI|nr:PLD nuclease N-terminal domain-containing protein [Rossellomorea vietnamensis]UXH44085.1 PLD nuclease N-terminal domain-containing protein [Rossellomorea vietnamensis]WQI95457.1 PLD nuclease N-terminal domain-containing protein [Rossellomorea vietnamensis]
MRQIDAYVDSVYQHIGGNRKEIQELKAEMKSHLLEAVHELRAEGMGEQEAVDVAIERFGGEQEMRSIVGQLFKAQKSFAKWVLYLALAVLLFTVSAFGYLWSLEEENANENSEVATQVSTILKDKTSVSDDMKNKINSLIDGTDQIANVEIYDVSSVKNTNMVFDYVRDAKPEYRYEQKVWSPKWLQADFFPYGNGDGKQWYVEMETRHMSDLMSIILFSGMAIYITLFTIWATINAYHQRRLNIGWIVVFALFNILGYLVYYVVGRKKLKTRVKEA